MTTPNTLSTMAIDTPPTLATLPYDIIHEIFKVCKEHTSISLGLTCTRLYDFLKVFRGPGPIPFYIYWHGSPYSKYRVVDISPLMSPKYVLHHLHYAFHWISTEVYGLEFNDKVHALETRLSDYYRCFRGRIPNRTILLPSPKGLGDDWYPRVAEIIIRDMKEYDCPKKWYEFWGGRMPSDEIRCFFFTANKGIFEKIRSECAKTCTCEDCLAGLSKRKRQQRLEDKKEARSCEDIIRAMDMENLVKPVDYEFDYAYYASWYRDLDSD